MLSVGSSQLSRIVSRTCAKIVLKKPCATNGCEQAQDKNTPHRYSFASRRKALVGMLSLLVEIYRTGQCPRSIPRVGLHVVALPHDQALKLSHLQFFTSHVGVD